MTLMKVYQTSTHVFIPQQLYSKNLYEHHLICVYIVNHPNYSVEENVARYYLEKF